MISNPPEASRTPLSNVLATLEAAAHRQKFRRMDFYKPYPKQQEFLDMGAYKSERLLMAGNQNGKTITGGFEAAVHLTGRYPDWWMGHRFVGPVRAWAAGETSLLVRDVQQKYLCGEPGVEDAFGTGMIPLEDFVDKPSLSRGVTDAFDTIQVQHYNDKGEKDGVSVLRFKSYEQGRTKFQGETLHFIWCDEEPPEEIYSEIVTRTAATEGIIFTTFTPLKGRSSVVGYFLGEDIEAHRGLVQMTIYDALHISAEQRTKMIASWPAHEREARSKGVPMMGSGRIFPYPSEALMVPTLEYIPPHWAKLWGIDFGIDHPFAAVLIAWDKDNDIIYILHAMKASDLLPINHAAAMKPLGAMVPVAWPQDGHQRDKGSGEVLSKSYKAQGLKMLAEHATWPDGGNSTEAGIMEMQDRMTTGRLKVAAHLAQWFEEYQLYHRKDGLIVKINDDILSATRIAIMMKRYARAVALGGRMGGDNRTNSSGGPSNVAKDVDFDVFAH